MSESETDRCPRHERQTFGLRHNCRFSNEFAVERPIACWFRPFDSGIDFLCKVWRVVSVLLLW